MIAMSNLKIILSVISLSFAGWVEGSVQFAIATTACRAGKGVFNICDETAKHSMCGQADDYDGQWCCEPEKE